MNTNLNSIITFQNIQFRFYNFIILLQQMKQQLMKKNIALQQNSFCVQFITTGERPQNFIKNVDSQTRFRQYPKLNALIHQKTELIKLKNHPPVYIKEDLKKFDLAKLGKFDVILMDPPWEEYEKQAKHLPAYLQKPEKYKSWTLDQLMKLNMEAIADNPSFLFLWVGSQHLDDGRQLFKKWGYKRCEDVVWVKTNRKMKQKFMFNQTNSILQRVKEHCLVGLKGDVKKASQSTFLHPNIDIDVIVDQQEQKGCLKKPQQLYDIIERFCLGRKRLQLFGENHNIRSGWLTIGKLINETNYIQQQYNSWFCGDINSKGFKSHRLMGTTNAIQNLRPKQPAKQGKQDQQQTPKKITPGKI